MTTEAYQYLRQRGFQLAGGVSDLSQRASVYHHMYADSGGRNIFPLIAAHGALWAAGYFKKGLLAGKILSCRHIFNKKFRQELLESLDIFANKFRDINRRVCAESYAIYYYTKIYGRTEVIESAIGKGFADTLCQSHESSMLGTAFNKHSRSTLFSAFFSWEQENIVAPSVTAAYNEFNWKTVKKLALKPKVEFSYFGTRNPLQFIDFSNKDERIIRGLQAYERAEEIGLDRVENALASYKVMPEAFILNPGKYFSDLEISIT
ncbi:hypothetical protein FNU76_00625 [Chitinimonas arctica]|uniref:Uncharacterized protein n=1 Tax=Chitinimonas arctica TaxID=2594795 RepID=A0A516S9Z5_9NEIS|nr:hypothetical protein [Chitinimonas arctica]QDQ24969.1 hypothetical protein FNU76_00625 [Chitinimonas arctica]